MRRRRLELLEIPPEYLSLHETIHKFRNTTIAHSQSELVMVLPLAMLIADVLDLLERAAQSVREQLRRTYADTDAATIATWPDPEIRHDLDAAYSAETKRPHSPCTGARKLHR